MAKRKIVDRVRDDALLKKQPKPIIKESAEDQLQQNSGSMENQKTYEDYNKERPLVKDANLKMK